MKSLKKILEVCLAVIALIVFIGLIQSKNMWLVICTYWCVLTVKNINDVVISNRKDKGMNESH